MIDEDVYREERERALAALWEEMCPYCTYAGWDYRSNRVCAHTERKVNFRACKKVAAARERMGK